MNTDALAALAGKTPPYPPAENQPETQVIRQFARDNQFQYTLRDSELVRYSRKDYKTAPAWLGMLSPLGKDAYHILSGSYKGHPLRMFLMWDHQVDGRYYQYRSEPTEEEKAKFNQQQTTGIVRIELSQTFPQVVLDSHKNDRARSSIAAEYMDSQRLELEGDFPKFFDLYAPEGLHVNVLSLLSPNMMQILKEHSGLFDVEFYGSEMILITRSPLYDPMVMNALDAALDEQLSYIEHLLLSWNYQPRQQPFDLLKKPAFTGHVLKIGNLRISSAVQVILVLLGFILFGAILWALN